MKQSILLLALALSPLASFAAASVNTSCGALRDYGDSLQIVDGRTNPYIDDQFFSGADADRKKITKYLARLGRRNGCYCVTGETMAFDRQGETAYAFTKLDGLMACKVIIR